MDGPAYRGLPLDARRVVVRGGVGSGKSTFARELARRLGVAQNEVYVAIFLLPFGRTTCASMPMAGNYS